LYNERAALESLPELPSVDGKENGRKKTAALKTGTDDLPILSDKKLTGYLQENLPLTTTRCLQISLTKTLKLERTLVQMQLITPFQTVT